MTVYAFQGDLFCFVVLKTDILNYCFICCKVCYNLVIIRFALGKKNLFISLTDNINLYYFAQVRKYTPIVKIRNNCPVATTENFSPSHTFKFITRNLEFPRDLNVYSRWPCSQYKNTEPHTGEYKISDGREGSRYCDLEGKDEDKGRWQDLLTAFSPTQRLYNPSSFYDTTHQRISTHFTKVDYTHSPVASIDLLSHT